MSNRDGLGIIKVGFHDVRRATSQQVLRARLNGDRQFANKLERELKNLRLGCPSAEAWQSAEVVNAYASKDREFYRALIQNFYRPPP